MGCTLLLHDVTAVERFEALRDGLAGEAGILVGAQTPCQQPGMLIKLSKRLDDLFDLLPGDILELHAGLSL